MPCSSLNRNCASSILSASPEPRRNGAPYGPRCCWIGFRARVTRPLHVIHESAEGAGGLASQSASIPVWPPLWGSCPHRQAAQTARRRDCLGATLCLPEPQGNRLFLRTVD